MIAAKSSWQAVILIKSTPNLRFSVNMGVFNSKNFRLRIFGSNPTLGLKSAKFSAQIDQKKKYLCATLLHLGLPFCLHHFHIPCPNPTVRTEPFYGEFGNRSRGSKKQMMGVHSVHSHR
jgi:hypothetical protein